MPDATRGVLSGIRPLLRRPLRISAHAAAVILINRHRQQREEDWAADHPQGAVPVPSFNHWLDDGKDVGKRHHQHHNTRRDQGRGFGFKENECPLQS